jgi:hypothetical protein
MGFEFRAKKLLGGGDDDPLAGTAFSKRDEVLVRPSRIGRRQNSDVINRIIPAASKPI